MDLGVPPGVGLRAGGFKVGDTVVVCRPDQIREAAVVVSCLPADRLTPIVAIEPPPMSEDRFVELHEQLERSRNERRQRPQDIAERLRLGRELGQYLSWMKHNQMVGDLLRQMSLGRAVFLAEFSPEELRTTRHPVFTAQAARVWGAYTGEDNELPDDGMFSAVPEQVHLRCGRPSELTDVAWRLLRGPDSTPERVIEMPADDPASSVVALFTALRTDAVLRPVDRPGVPLDELFTPCNPDSDEATLVENTADVNALLGTLYAHHRGAHLVVTSPPDLTDSRRAIDERQRRIVARGRLRNEGKGSAVGRRLRRWFARNPCRDLERAVTAQVPPAAVAAVGRRRLTAFTTGLPYSFVRTEDVDWARKPIGHVAADPLLIILNEVYSEGVERAVATFSLVFDPGFFEVSETEDVMAASRHVNHPIRVPGPGNVALDALGTLPRDLPVELLFFNTHGTDDAIVLGERVVMENWLIPQYLNLSHRPVVFNNSCQSWTGVGREFVRVGARGYIGSLWSVPSERAADFGRTVVNLIAKRGRRVCDAIVDTSLTAGIERSYLYVGTANGRLHQQGDRTVTPAEASLAACATLAQVALRQGAVAPLLLRKITELRETVESTPYSETPDHLDVLLDELALSVQDDTAEEEEVHRLLSRIDGLLERLDLPQEAADRRRATQFELTGTWHERRDAVEAAVADFCHSMAYSGESQPRPDLLLRAARLRMRHGQLEEARLLAQEAYDLYLRQDDQHGLLETTGMLGRLSSLLDHHDEALRHAENSRIRAQELGSRKRQADVLLDEAQLHQVAGDLDAAITAATTVLAQALADHDDQQELTATGSLCISYLSKGDLNTAAQYAATGLARAEILEAPINAAYFQWFTAEILRMRGSEAEALRYYVLAASPLVRLKAWAMAAPVLHALADCAARLQNADALWSVATWGSKLCVGAEQHLWSDVLPLVVGSLKKAIETGTFDATKKGLQDLGAVVLARHRDLSPAHMQFLGEVFTLVLHWLVSDHQVDLVGVARRLDSEVRGGDLGLEALVSVPYVRFAHNHGIQPGSPSP
ncbi:tetratricopeptide repeat protein [Streptomyces stelliscabiei]|uniref:tetratricopeptide repeat protein n=1 Tax=Streptomyces stelliscabiei TaxID=146820 RepID=UPI002FF17F95